MTAFLDDDSGIFEEEDDEDIEVDIVLDEQADKDTLEAIIRNDIEERGFDAGDIEILPLYQFKQEDEKYRYIYNVMIFGVAFEERESIRCSIAEVFQVADDALMIENEIEHYPDSEEDDSDEELGDSDDVSSSEKELTSPDEELLDHFYDEVKDDDELFS